MSQALRDQLVRLIEDAFADVKYPGDKFLDGKYDYGEEKYFQEFKGQHWKDIPVELLAIQGLINSLQKRALRFYIPAYLINIVRNPGDMDTVVDDIVGFLSPDPDFPWQVKEMPRFKEFRPKEKRAIRTFIEKYQELFPEGYWSLWENEKTKLERAINYWEHYG